MTSSSGHSCVFSALTVSNSIFFRREVCLFTKRPECNPYTGWPATKLQRNAERWKRGWCCHSPYPSYKHHHILVICHSNRCAKGVHGEKRINRSEHRQSWSGMGQFNDFKSVCVCVYMWDVHYVLWYVSSFWMFVSRWWAGTCWPLDGLFINHEACGISLSSP